jgi:hypothetical protein
MPSQQPTLSSTNTFHSDAALIASNLNGGQMVSDTQPLRFDDLMPVEQAAASLGVSAMSYKPMKDLNDAYYVTLKQQNALDPTLQRRIEAYSYVAGKDLADN